MSDRHKRRFKAIDIIAINVVFVVVIIFLFFSYRHEYDARLYEQNLNELRNVNQAAAQIASELSVSYEHKLNNILQYSSRRNLNSKELLTYIDDGNADANVEYQLIGSDYTGFVVELDDDGIFVPVSYANRDYKKNQQIVDAGGVVSDNVPYTVEFTNPNNGFRSFARYVPITITNDGVEEHYVLLAVLKSEDFVSHIALDGGFEGLSTVVINTDGRYALRNIDYKSDNFYQYLTTYNDLTLDEQRSIQEQVLSCNNGTFQFNNSLGEECAFVYSCIPGTDWYCISGVPITSFHNTNPDYTFTAIFVLILALMMALDQYYLMEMNRRLKETAKAANAANEAKTDFLSRMSHDIRTPINVISGMTELALMEDNSARTSEYLENIQSSGRFLLGLVNDILDMNKVESGNMELHPKPYRFEEFSAYIKSVICPLCNERHIHFTMKEENDGAIIIVDQLRLNQILFNLLSNAVKFTQPGGHIVLSEHTKTLDNHKALVDIEIQDDGAGMSLEFQKVMFSSFAQEERTLQHNGVGTGLGLSIVKNLVELMKGSIRVDSTQDIGTTFYLHFEFDTVDEEQIPKEQSEAHISIVGKRILLCEDHPLNTKIIVRVLEQREVVIETAANGQLGVEKFVASTPGYYDAILMDIRMPVMNGIEAARAIRALTTRTDSKTIPIIALTANAYDTDVQSCLEAGMNEHLAKPIDSQKLCDTLARLIRK